MSNLLAHTHATSSLYHSCTDLSHGPLELSAHLLSGMRTSTHPELSALLSGCKSPGAWQSDLHELKAAVEGADAILDSNGDGKITLSELVEKMDADGDGKVTLNEFMTLFQNELAIAEGPTVIEGDPNVNLLFDDMDTNKNGKVTKFEFMEWLKDKKPKEGPWNSTTKLQAQFKLDKA